MLRCMGVGKREREVAFEERPAGSQLREHLEEKSHQSEERASGKPLRWSLTDSS